MDWDDEWCQYCHTQSALAVVCPVYVPDPVTRAYVKKLIQ
jgi:hypothetical protein